jgi:hypothetical protein
VSAEPATCCEDCGSAVATGQRYCLGCGARIGSRSPLLLALVGGGDDRGAREEPAGQPETPELPDPAQRESARGLSLPPPRISLLIVLAFLGFGVLLGAAAASSVNSTLAASARRHVKVVYAPSAPLSSAASSSSPSSPSSPSAASSASSSAEPPLPEETPTPRATAPAKQPTAAAKAPATAGGGEREAPAGSEPTGSHSGGSSSKLPPVKHVFVIMLSDQPYAAVFGPSSTAPYLSRTLEGRGELLVRYDALAHEQLANEVALLSGQGPTPATAANCATYADIAPGTSGAQQQVAGDGCVYPAATQTLPGQLMAKHLSWRAYVQGIEGEDGVAQAPGSCGHPAPGAPDLTAAAPQPGAAYATFRNPFVYFHSLIDSPACKKGDVGLSRLSADLGSAARTPSFSYIVPDRCHDGSPTPCSPGAPAGVPAADAFLKGVVPEIVASKAYKHGGLLVITVDEAPSSGEFADSSSCCGQPSFPNLAAAATGLARRGGGAVGALLLSPFVKGATTSQEPYNHFSLLRTIEDLFGLRHLGYAGAPGVSSFEPSLFSPYAPH